MFKLRRVPTRFSITSHGMLNFGLVHFLCVSRDSLQWSVLIKTSQSMYSYVIRIDPSFPKRVGILMTFLNFENISRFLALLVGNRMLCIYFRL